ncbi:MAG TPA: peptidylprolyl isomerase [candidate division Zixibacteria bacterium]|nr:peptidylprolyl isomerase [candidate division Zixibacteria bacterium]HEQ99638.1 peptidylprolyl isomerase [candidate division Zixibacteria bacterium]
MVTIERNKLEAQKYEQKINVSSDGGDTTIILTAEKVPNPVVLMETSMGDIKLELFPEVAPIHVQNFLNLTRSGFYDSLIFHRVIDGFMIQAGGYTDELELKPARNIPAEFNDSLHREGTLAMARRDDPNSASSQFYICLAPRPGLDGRYTVFGKTIEGLDVVHEIGKVETNKGENRDAGLMPNQPLEPVYIEKMNILVDYEPDE